MVAFVVGRAVRTAEPTVTVDAGLAIGVHRFQLEVVAADGRRSAADIVEVSVLRLRIPDPLQPVVRPDLVDPVTGPVVNPVTNPVIAPVPTPGRIDPGTLRPGAAPRADAAPAGRPRGTRKRGPRKPVPEAPPDVSSSVSSEAPAAGRQARNTRRSKK